MTPSKLTDAVERGVEKLKEEFAMNVYGAVEWPDFEDDIRTFARDLILAVEDSLPPEKSGCMNCLSERNYRAEILGSLYAFLGDNK